MFSFLLLHLREEEKLHLPLVYGES
jgi:hypothetical protein